MERKRLNDSIVTKKNRLICILLCIFYFGVIIFLDTQVDILLSFVSKEFANQYINLIFYTLFFVICIVCFRKEIFQAIKGFIAEYEKYIKRTVVYLIITLALMVISAITLNAFSIGESSNEIAVDEHIKSFGFQAIVYVCLFGPVVEEFIFRGIIFNLLRGEEQNVVRTVLAVLATAVIFGMYHCDFMNFSLYELLSVLPLMLMGLALTVLYNDTKNIICPIAVHIAVNCIATFG